MAAYDTLTDSVLLALLKEGDRAAYTEIYGRYERLLYLHAYKRLRDREEARDLVQDLLLVLWTKREQLQFRGSLRAYLFTSVRNRVFDLFARGKVRSEYLSSLQGYIEAGHYTADHQARYNQLMALIDQEIGQLPAKMRQVFELSRNEQLSHKEIADSLNLSEQTVRKQVHNALKILRVKLGPLFLLLLW